MTCKTRTPDTEGSQPRSRDEMTESEDTKPVWPTRSLAFDARELLKAIKAGDVRETIARSHKIWLRSLMHENDGRLSGRKRTTTERPMKWLEE